VVCEEVNVTLLVGRSLLHAECDDV